MRKILPLITILFLAFNVFAQTGGGGDGKARKGERDSYSSAGARPPCNARNVDITFNRKYGNYGPETCVEYAPGLYRWADETAGVYNTALRGVIADVLSISCSISLGSQTLTCPSGSFNSTYNGRTVNIPFAGGSNQMLKTTITGAPTATTLTIATPAVAAAGSVTTWIGSDNTAYIQNTLNDADAAGGGDVIIPPGMYFIDYLTIPKNTVLRGGGVREATILVSARGSGGIIRSIWPSNSSTGVNVTVKNLTIQAIDGASVQYGIHDNGGAYVTVNNVAIKDTHIGILFDQTQVSKVYDCDIAPYVPAFTGLMGGLDPVAQWSKTGSAIISSDSGFLINNSTGLNTTAFWSKALNSDAFNKGFTVKTLGGIVVLAADNAGFDDAKLMRLDNGAQRYDLQFTSTQIRLNGGTARSFSASSIMELRVAIGGATASLWIDGVEVDSGIAASATAGSAIIGFGDFATNDDANVGYKAFGYTSTNPVPVGLWVVNGDTITPGNSGGYTNVIQVFNNQFNGVAVHVAIDGGTDHIIRENNFNGGLWPLSLAGSVNLTVHKNAFEGNQWHTLVLRNWGIDGEAKGNSSGTKITSNTFNSITFATDVPPLYLLSGIDLFLEGNVYTKASGNAVDIDPSGFGKVTVNEVLTSGATLFNSAVQLSYLFADTITFNTPFQTINVNSLTGSYTINGVLNGSYARSIILTNEGSNDFYIGHQNAGASIENRIITSVGHNLLVEPGNRVRLDYDMKNQRWRASLLQ